MRETRIRMSATARVTVEAVNAEPALKPKRRRHSIPEKRQIVEESFDPRTSVARVARAHGINANQVFTWRRLYQRGQLGVTPPAARPTELLPVKISELPAAPATSPPAASVATLAPTGTIQLQLVKGRLRIEGVVDPESLRV